MPGPVRAAEPARQRTGAATSDRTTGRHVDGGEERDKTTDDPEHHRRERHDRSTRDPPTAYPRSTTLCTFSSVCAHTHQNFGIFNYICLRSRPSLMFVFVAPPPASTCHAWAYP